MGYYDFPHTRNYDTDLGYLIQRYFELNTEFDSLEKNFDDLKAWCIAQLNSEALKTLVANKLDEWLQDGTLAALINNPLNHVTTYDTVVEMLTHSGLLEDSKIYCTGADSVNDGKGGHFRIRARLSTDVIDNYNLYLIDGSLKVAERVTDISLNYVTPQMYGAKGDGKTDDSAAFQKALDSGTTVFIPKGTYKILTPLSSNVPYLVLKGENIVETILTYQGDNDTYCLSLVGNQSSGINRHFYLENFTIKCLDKQNNGINLKYNTYYSYLSNISINNGNIGINSTQNWGLSFNHMIINGCNTAGRFTTLLASEFNNCHFRTSTDNFIGESIRSCTFNSCNFEGANNNGFSVSNCYGLTLNSVYEEACVNTAFKFITSNAIAINGLNAVGVIENSTIIHLELTSGVTINGFHTEVLNRTNANGIILKEGRSISIDGSLIKNISTGIKSLGDVKCSITTPYFENVTVPLEFTSSADYINLCCDYNDYAISTINNTHNKVINLYNLPSLSENADHLPLGYMRFTNGRPIWANGSYYYYADGTRFTG